MQHLGLLRDDRSLALAYQATDYLLSPSLLDSGPMMVLEALLCGTPVIAFPVGYAADIVPKFRLGRIAKHADTADLAESIAAMIKMSESEIGKMRKRCRESALAYCSPPNVAAQYAEFYQRLLGNGRDD